MSDVPDWQGIAFDMDGTLVDTEHVHFDAWNEVFGRFDVGPFEQQWCAAFPLHLLSKRQKKLRRFEQWIGRSAPSLGAEMVAGTTSCSSSLPGFACSFDRSALGVDRIS